MATTNRRRDAPLYVAVVAGLLAVLTAVVTAIWAAQIVDSARRTDARAQAVSESAGRLTGLVVDAETGQRGFLLTGDEQYLEAYRRADARIPAELRTLSSLTASSATQSATVDELRQAIQQKMSEMSTTIRLRRSGGFDAAVAIVDSDEGKRLMNEIRLLGADLRASAEATARFEGRRSEQAGLMARTMGLTAAGLALALLLSMLALLIHRGRLTKAKVAAEGARERLSAELAQLSSRDPLTGLPNRQLLEDRLAQALRRCEQDGSLLALLLINIDNFREVNEASGHVAGDALLTGAGDRLVRQLRPADTLARWGGDEFVALCEGLADEQEAAAAAERLQEACASPFQVADRQLEISLSVGYVLAGPEGVVGARELAATPEALLSAADAAMRSAKEDGRARARVFDASAARSRSDRQQLLVDLRRADDEELWLAYQPLVELDGGRVVGVEALSRWEHPIRGPVSPAQFVPLAEDSGLIVELGASVLQEACRQGGAWNRLRQRHGLGPLKMSVNVSARQLLDPGFVETARKALEAGPLPPEDLTLELTETALIEGAQLVTRNLNELVDLGVTLALDDFGTGYSSLAYLRQLPIGLIKIDRSFTAGMVRNHADRMIVRAIIGLAHNLERPVLAEGIETAEQARYLRSLGCGLGQGYCYGRPVHPIDLAGRVTRTSTSGT